jgi:integrase
MFTWGVSREFFGAEVITRLESLGSLPRNRGGAKQNAKVRPVDWELAKQVIPHVSSTVGAMIQVHYLTGMRQDEVCRLSMDAIDRSAPVWLYSLNKHKTDEYLEEKIVCIGPQAQEILRPFIDKYPTGYLFRPADTVAERTEQRRTRGRPAKRIKHGRPRKTNDHYTSHAYFNAIKNGFRLMLKAKGVKVGGRQKLTRAIAKEGGLEWWHPPQLRHARGRLTRRKYNAEASASQLGHGLKVNEIYTGQAVELAMRVALETG